MSNEIVKIPLDKLSPHPDNPNRMSKATFAKLVRNIERTGRYEPLVVRRTTYKTGKSGEIVGNLSSSTGKKGPDVEKNKLRKTTYKSTKSGENDQNISSSTYKNQSKSRDIGGDIRRTTYTGDTYQIINGHHRWLALKQLGYEFADAVVWDVDDGEAALLLATLNRLCGRDVLDKKLALLKRLTERARPAELAKLLPHTKKQIEKLNLLTSSDCRMSIEKCKSEIGNRQSQMFSNPLVFFVSDDQQQIVETAVDYALQNENALIGDAKTKAAKRASALSAICRYYLDNAKKERADA